jgi:site-specific recombinase XerD
MHDHLDNFTETLPHNVLYGTIVQPKKGTQVTDSEDPHDRPISTQPLIIIEPATGMPVPAMIAAAGERASLRFIDFFIANIRNPNTRAAYGVSVRGFFNWLETCGLAELGAIRTHHVSTYIEMLTRRYSAPTVKQHLAAIRRLFDWLIVGQLIHQNPAAPVRGPSHIVKKGKTPVLDGDEAKRLIDSIDVSTIAGLRDRALIALLIYSFARISAALHMNVEGYYPQGKRWWVRLHEKGGKQHEMPAHHLLESYVDAYVTAAGFAAEKASPLFRTLGDRGRTQLTLGRMTRQDARRMIVRRAQKAGLLTRIGCHSFRATGITVYLLNGGLLEYAQQMAAHESARTTKPYDRRNDQVTLDQVERIVL